MQGKRRLSGIGIPIHTGVRVPLQKAGRERGAHPSIGRPAHHRPCPPGHTLRPPKSHLRPAAVIQRPPQGRQYPFLSLSRTKKQFFRYHCFAVTGYEKFKKQSFFRCFPFFLRTYPGALPKTSCTKSRCSFRLTPASYPAKLAVRPLPSSGYLFPSPSAPCFYAKKATPLFFAPSGPSAF